MLTIQSGINKLRYATLIGIKQAKNKPMRKVAWAEVEPKLSENQQQIERLYVPVKQKKTEMIEGRPARRRKRLVGVSQKRRARDLMVVETECHIDGEFRRRATWPT